jgi:hypothetical protein
MVTRPCPNTMSNDILIQKGRYVFPSYLLHLCTTLPIAWSGKRWSSTVICKNIDANVEALLIFVYSFLFNLLNAISEEQWNLNQINWKGNVWFFVDIEDLLSTLDQRWWSWDLWEAEPQTWAAPLHATTGSSVDQTLVVEKAKHKNHHKSQQIEWLIGFFRRIYVYIRTDHLTAS